MLRKLIPVLAVVSMVSCGGSEEDPKPKIEGCTNELSLNFNSEATHNDGSCIFPSDKMIGDWEVNEQVIFFNPETLTSEPISSIEYNAAITSVSETEIAITTDRPTPPAYIYTGNLMVDWVNSGVGGPGSVSGMIYDEDNFGLSYTYGTPSGVHMVEVTYQRVE